MKTTLTKKALLSVIAFLIVTFCFTIFALTVSADEIDVSEIESETLPGTYGVLIETWDSKVFAYDIIAELYENAETEEFTLYIHGTGRLRDWESYSYKKSTAPWYYSYHNKLTKVIIDDGITHIGQYSFYDCNNLKSIEIPNSVTGIGKLAFYNCFRLTSIDIPNCVTSIGISAFEGCSGLTSIEIPSSVTSIGIQTFYNCSSLTSIEIPSSVTSIGSYAFYNCRSLSSIKIPFGVTNIDFPGCSSLTNVEIPDSVTNISFSGCSSLTNVEIPNSVTNINFSGCSSLTNVEIPNSVTSINFYNCSSLTSVVIPNSVTKIENSAFQFCTNLANITFEENSNITSIGNDAFHGCSSLTSIEIPRGVTSIGGYAFYFCRNLTSIKLPESVTNIYTHAFEECINLKEVHITNIDAWCQIEFSLWTANPVYFAKFLYLNGNLITDISISSIKQYTFYNCLNLTSVEITGDVTSIGGHAFYGCSNLSSIIIPYGVTSIESAAFYDCSSLSGIIIPDSVTKIGSYAFYDCSSLSGIIIPDSVTNIGSYAFYGCGSLSSISLPEGLENVGERAFLSCYKLQYIKIPKSLTSIGQAAFYKYDGIRLIIIDSYEIAKNFAFCYNNSFIFAGTIAINAEITEIDSYVDNYKNVSVLNVPVNDNVVKYIVYSQHSHEEGADSSAWSDKNEQCIQICGCGIQKVTHVADEAVVENVVDATCQAAGSYENVVYCTDCGAELSREKVETPKVDHAYELISRIPFGNSTYTCNMCGDTYEINEYGDPIETWDISATSNDNVIAELYNDPDNEGMYALRIYGTGAMKDWASDSYYGINTPWHNLYNENITIVVIECGVTNIGNVAFQQFYNLTSVNFADSIINIGTNAFYECINLTNIELPNQLVSINPQAFSKCSGLINLKIPNSVTTIKYSAFYGCSSLDSIIIPNNMINMEGGVFSQCVGLTNVKILDGVTNISASTFYGCSNLTNVELPNTLESIEGGAFQYCANLTNIVIPNSVTTIGGYAFYGCTGLTSIVISNNVTTIENSTFYNCKSLLNIELPEKLTIIGADAFRKCVSLSYIEIPSNVTTIGNGAFWNCSSLEKVDILGAEIIEQDAFKGCSNLTILTIPENLTNIGREAFYSCSKLTEVHITDMVAWCKINFSLYSSNPVYYSKALYLNDNLVTDLIIPNGVEKLNDNVFYNCASLTSVILPSGIKSIGICAFSDCSSLTSIEIPDSVTSIGGSAFNKCYNLKEVHISSIDAWCRINFNSLASNPMYSSNNGANLYLNGNLVTEVTISENVHSYAFIKCSSLTNVKILEGATYIGNYAFAYCYKLTSIEIPDSVTSIGDYAFCYCSNLASIELPSNVRYINQYAFSSCRSLTSIEIPNNVTVISSYAFSYCYDLISVKIPDCVTRIDERAFYYCSKLTNIEIPSNVTKIDLRAFDGCSSMKLVIIDSPTIASSITSYTANGYLTNYATTVLISSDITEIGSYITSNFTNVTTIGDYVVYSKHSHEADSAVWGEADENGIQVCSECGLEKVSHVHSYDDENDGVCNGCGEVRGVARIGEEYFATFQEALANGSGKTIVLLETVVITEDTVFDISDVTIESFGDVFEVQAGTLTLNGNGTVNAGISGVGSWCAVWANGGHVIINGGTYSVGGDSSTSDVNHQNDLIYTKNGGTVTINGGTFVAGEGIWTLNENDANRGTIVVKGGTFIGFDPANNVSEGPDTSFVVSGYHSHVNADGNYTVEAIVEEIIPSVAPSCGVSGLTEGVKCAICGEIIIPQTTIEASSHVNEIIPAIPGELRSPGMTSGVKCSVCGETLVAPVQASGDFRVGAVSLNLGENVSIIYKVAVPAGYENVYMVFEMTVLENGVEVVKTFKVEEYEIGADGRYWFTFSGIRLQYMADLVTATVYAEQDGIVSANSYSNYSVKSYITGQLAKASNSAELKTMLSDLLILGEKTQIYTNYRADNLMTADVDASLMKPSTYAGVPSQEFVQKMIVNDESTRTIADWKSVSLTFKDAMSLQFKLAIDPSKLEGIEIKVYVPVYDGTTRVDTYTAEDFTYNASEDRYILFVDNIKASQYGQTVVGEIYYNGEQISRTVNYSVNSYIQKNQDNSNVALRDFLRAAYQYGLSVFDYAY